jgi:hypothetical protein
MRKIEKSENVPATLVNASMPKKASDVKDYIYKALDVRDQLVQDQHSKCAYCECKISRQYNDVEHFRPKSHYYWLGHEWKNLLLPKNGVIRLNYRQPQVWHHPALKDCHLARFI